MQFYRPLWEYIQIRQFNRPPAPTGEAVRKGMNTLVERLLPFRRPTMPKQDGLRSVPPYLINRAVPPPSGLQMAKSLDAQLTSWQIEQKPKQPVQVIVGAPGSGVEQAVLHFARQKRWRIVGPPSASQILDGGGVWLEKVKDVNAGPIVIPRLGKCYLRHQDGLNLMSDLLEWLRTTPRRVLIACDSWAWSYLQHSLEVDIMLPEPLTLAPFDGARLQFWLPSLARRIHRDAFIFRDMKDGHLLFPITGNSDIYKTQDENPTSIQRYGDWVTVNNLLRQLAAYSRGMPEIIWALWRNCLRVSADLPDDQLRQRATKDQGYTVWVQPWSQLRLPVVPKGLSTSHLFVLHSMLLHGGATADLLAELLPISYSQVSRVLHSLEEMRLIGNYDGVWRTELIAYPSIRHRMVSEGYLVDKF